MQKKNKSKRQNPKIASVQVLQQAYKKISSGKYLHYEH